MLIVSQSLWFGGLFAKDLQFVPRASISVAKFEFSKPPTANALPGGGAFPEVKFDMNFKLLGVGGTLFKENYYLDVFYQKSLEDKASFSVEIPGDKGGRYSDNFKGARRDASFTFGKKILDGRASVYGGYRSGKTGGPQSQGRHLSFEEKGFFVGGNYGWLVSDSGVLSVNLAYAKLDGNRTQKAITGVEAFPYISLNGEGDTKGLSYGVNWSSRLTDHISYSAGLEVREYDFKKIKDVNPQIRFLDRVNEKFTAITFSTYYSF
jgi:hypothetical protein